MLAIKTSTAITDERKLQNITARFASRQRQGSPAYEQDRELAARILEGDKEALTLLIDRHIGPVYKYLMRRLGPGNEALTGEVVEAAFAEAFSRLAPYARGQASLPMRLRLIRLANKHLSKRRRGVVLSVPQEKEENEELAALRHNIAKLPMRHQAALALALFEEMPPEELAGALRATPSGAMRLLRGALKRVGRQSRQAGLH